MAISGLNQYEKQFVDDDGFRPNPNSEEVVGMSNGEISPANCQPCKSADAVLCVDNPSSHSESPTTGIMNIASMPIEINVSGFNNSIFPDYYSHIICYER